MRKSAIGLVGAWLLLGCSEANHGMLDAGGSQAACEASYQAALNRTCLASTDCVLVDHDDCCGTVRVGVRAGTESAATTAEATYQACFYCGARGCLHADVAEDGHIAGAGQSIVATCAMGRCKSVVQ